MTLHAGTYDIGPKTGALRLFTSREGLAAKVGHDLTIGFGSWSGQVVLTGSSADGATVEARVEIDSVEIVDGTGGAMPLGGNDRRDIRATALKLLEADRYPEATFTSSSITAKGDGATMAGTLTVRGQSVPVSFEVTSGDPSGGDAAKASATLRQSGFGIKPYKAFLGALRLADDVRIEVEVTLPDPA